MSERRVRPKTPNDLDHNEALMQETELWRLLSNGEAETVRVHSRFNADNGETLLAAALTDLGIIMVPDFLTEAYLASGALAPVFVDQLRRKLVLLFCVRSAIFRRARCGR
jgi:DNA-binding transcriptional LysR family regulator